jgi:hypothetical protein
MAELRLPSRIIKAILISCAARQLFLSPAQSLLVETPSSAKRLSALTCLIVSAFFFAAPVSAQKDKKNTPPAPTMKRSTLRHEVRRLSYGGTVTLSAAPAGSIIIEGWSRNEVEVSAEIELEASTAEDLDRLLMVNNFIVDEDANHIRILTTGSHDKVFMKRVAKNFPKSLLGLPWKIDYRIKVPAITDLTIDAGNGPIKLSGVEGAIRLNALMSIADLTLTGGIVSATVQSGAINVAIPARGWHGLGADIKLASGKLNVDLLPGFNADIDAQVMRAGEIKSTYANLEPRERNSITPRSVRARRHRRGHVDVHGWGRHDRNQARKH